MIYLDNSSTTKIKKEVLDEMMPFLTDNYGNASSKYPLGQVSKKAIEKARKQVMDFIYATNGCVVFTSGGSESNNLILKGLQKTLKEKNKTHIITTKVEHKSVLNTCKFLETQGFNVTYLPVEKSGCVDTEKLEKAITSNTGLISVMYMNNEIGSANDIELIGKIAHKHNILFHSDCVQAAGVIGLNVDSMNVDFLSISGHKINAPKGIGCAYLRYPELIEPQISGGQQEFGLRAGTENVPYIVGFGKACEIYNDVHVQSLLNTHRYFIEKLKTIEGVKINGNPFDKVINLNVQDVDNESLMLLLAEQGVYVSTGSACNSNSIEPSYVLKSLGLKDDEIRSSIRISLPIDIGEDEIDSAITILKNSIKILKEI